jgi:hypothetical protein
MLPLTLILCASSACLAQGGTLLDTPACRRAIEALDTREAAAAKDRGAAARAPLEAARRQAAVACLGGPDVAASAARSLQRPPVVRVPSAASPASPAAPAPRVPVPVPMPAPAPRSTPPVTLTTCDATGCWTSDGTRLQRAGPDTLLGPRGICTVAGAVVQCPQ